MELQGQVAIVTGAGRGIGRATALELARMGADIVVAELDAGGADKTAALVQDVGRRAAVIPTDVTKRTELAAMVDRTLAAFGRIDVLVNNAGIYRAASTLEITEEHWDAIMTINAKAVFFATQAVLPTMIAAKRGAIVSLASMAGKVGSRTNLPYNASKAAVEQFANALRLEVAHHGVDVGSAHMSWVDTAMVRDTKTDLSTFGEMLSKLPYPVNVTTSVEKCGAAFVDGIEGRKTRVYCPRWVGALRWLKPIMSTRIGEAPIKRFVPDLLPRMDAEVVALGRSTSAHSEALDSPSTT